VSDRAPAWLDEEKTLTKIPGAAFEPPTLSRPPLSVALETVTAAALGAGSTSAPSTTNAPMVEKDTLRNIG